MSSDNEKRQEDKKVIHLDVDERLPTVTSSSQGAEVVKQIIEQILTNERRRARLEFIQLSVFFLVCLVAIMGSGIWFARQLLAQLHDERVLTEQVWQIAGGRVQGVTPGFSGAAPVKPALNRDEVAKLEKNIKTVSNLLKTNPQDSSVAIQDMLKSQENTIQALNARLNAAQGRIVGVESGADAVAQADRQVDFIAAPVADDLKLRMPIP